MCRRLMYFRGFHKVRDQWADEAWEERCAEIMGEAIDATVTEAVEMAGCFPKKWRSEIIGGVISDIKDIEKTMNFLKSEGIAADDIEYVLFETDDYYSDRHINKWWWCDEPPKNFETRYPLLAKGRWAPLKRVRARQDPWITLSFYVEV